MPRNIEIKARNRRPQALRRRVAALADGAPRDLLQDDCFFPSPHGRLKLRQFGDGSGELIFYRRADTAAPASSDYCRVPTADPETLRQTLMRAYGCLGRVRKLRRLYLVGQTRVHLDQVQDLGHFVELECVLAAEQSLADGIAEVQRIMALLGIQADDCIAQSYLDLLRERGSEAAGA